MTTARDAGSKKGCDPMPEAILRHSKLRTEEEITKFSLGTDA